MTGGESLGYAFERMNRAEFLSELSRLERWFKDEAPSIGCIGSSDVRASAACMFSHNLENSHRCTHCSDCVDCSDLSHSTGCASCHASAYLAESRHCTHSAYLVRCVSCTECTYCFGCVGLSKKDFHILNQPYSRKEYFAVVEKLKKELGLR